MNYAKHNKKMSLTGTKSSEDIRNFHKAILTLDSHCDLPKNFKQSMFDTGYSRQVDFPKMRQGGLSTSCFVAYVPQGKCDQNSYEKAFKKAIHLLQSIGEQRGCHGNLDVDVCDRVAQVRKNHRQGKISIIPVIENGYVMGEDISRLDIFRDLGARYLTLTHNGHNALADSAVPRPALGDKKQCHHGLSSLGRRAVERMNKLGIVVDVSHGSRETMVEATELSNVPVIASHSCVKSLCDHRRNLDDEQLKLLAERRGVIQITAMADFLRKGGDKPGDRVTVADFVDHLDYVVNLVGPQYVGISSDFEGGGGIEGWDGVTDSLNITQELLRRGYDKSEISAFWGGNCLRVFQEAEDYAQR